MSKVIRSDLRLWTLDFRLGFILMCGIAGIISHEPEARIRPMLDSIEHRGRDDEGVWTSLEIDDAGRRACLGHRRLSIIDTSSAGHQPMLSADGRFVLTFNGEIYNYLELKRELESRGLNFQTDTDTEPPSAARRSAPPAGWATRPSIMCFPTSRTRRRKTGAAN